MDLKIPTSEQARWGLRAMKTVALADGALNDSERQMLEAVQRVFGTTHEVEGLLPIAPEELAVGLPDQQIRNQLVNGLIVMSLIDQEVKPVEAELVERFAVALHVSIPSASSKASPRSLWKFRVERSPVKRWVPSTSISAAVSQP